MIELLKDCDPAGLALLLASAVALALSFASLPRLQLVLMTTIVVVSALVSSHAPEPPRDMKVDLTIIPFLFSLTRRVCAGLSILMVAVPLGRIALGRKVSLKGLVVLGPFGVGLALSGSLLLGTLIDIVRNGPDEDAAARIALMIGRANMLVGVLTGVSCVFCLELAVSMYREQAPR